jgi:hypothetical protein
MSSGPWSQMGILDVGAETKVSSGGCYQAMGFLDAYCSRSACCPILGRPDYRVDRHQFFEFLIAEPALTKYVIYILCAER